jgi:hypothetical protein
MIAQGISLQGVNIINKRTFTGIGGLAVDFDSTFGFTKTATHCEWKSLVGNVTVFFSSSTSTIGIQNTPDGILFDNTTGDITNMRAFGNLGNARDVLECINLGYPFGIYAIGKTITGTTFLSFYQNATAYAGLTTLISGGDPRIYMRDLGTNVNKMSGIQTNTERCIGIVRNGDTSNNELVWDNTTKIVRSITTTPTALPDNLDLRMGSTNGVIKRFLMYDWRGKTPAEVNTLDLQVKQLITEQYGMIF